MRISYQSQNGNESKHSLVQVTIPVDGNNAEFDHFDASLLRVDDLNKLNNSDSDTLAFENPEPENNNTDIAYAIQKINHKFNGSQVSRDQYSKLRLKEI